MWPQVKVIHVKIQKKNIYALVNTDGSFQNQKAKYNYFF